MVTPIIRALGRLWQDSEFKARPGLHSKVFSLSMDQSRGKLASQGLRVSDGCASRNLLRELLWESTMGITKGIYYGLQAVASCQGWRLKGCWWLLLPQQVPEAWEM